jgi:hypothetical protein
MTTAVRLWEKKKGEGECKNQICRCCHPWDEGGLGDLTITTPGRDDTHTNSAMRACMVLSNVRLAAGEGGGAAQDVVEDDGGGTVVGGGEDCGKDQGNADGNGHGHRHGHGRRGRDDATLTGGGLDDGGTLLANRHHLPGDDVMAEDGLTFLLLHIGHRTQSSTLSTTHKCFQKMVVGTFQSNNHLEVSFL